MRNMIEISVNYKIFLYFDCFDGVKQLTYKISEKCQLTLKKRGFEIVKERLGCEKVNRAY